MWRNGCGTQANKTTRGSEWRGVPKKDLTEPTLLEISDYRDIRT